MLILRDQWHNVPCVCHDKYIMGADVVVLCLCRIACVCVCIRTCMHVR